MIFKFKATLDSQHWLFETNN